jgi:hypothetical protein
MSKSVINIILFIFIITLFMILFLNPNIHGFRTPQPIQVTPSRRIFRTPNDINQPILISPSNVRFITPQSQNTIEAIIDNVEKKETKRGFNVLRQSPTGSVTASTIFNIPIEFPKSNNIINIVEDRPGFIFNDKTRKFPSIGEKLCCKIFEQWIYNKSGILVEVTRNLRPDFLRNPNVKNPTRRNNLELDMIYERIAIEYNGGQHTQYVASMHKSYEDYEKQVSNDAAKALICKNVGIELIIVPADIDSMKTDKNGNKKYIRLTEKQRENKIREFLLPKLEQALINING